MKNECLKLIGNNIKIKDKFIRFLKDNHAFDEYKEEILPYTLDDLKAQFLDGGAEFLLNDGCIFHWRLASTSVNWEVLAKKWIELLEKENRC